MRLLTILCLVLLSSCSQETEVVTGHILIRDGITYHQDTNEPFTGTVEYYYDDGQLSRRRHFIDGKPDGLSEGFYENGQLDITGNLTDGKRNGLFKRFDENGQLETRGNYKDGELHGLFEYFDEEGNLTETVTYENGVEVK
jgi:antitoxin component YwqK of YwqJK toxin-antitoxin module